MATRNINTKITLSGEQEYRDAIKNINSGLGVLNSEMKKVSAQYGENAKSVEALTAQNEVLERKLLSQREKVETLRQAVAESAKEYGEADKRTMAWQKQLNEAEAACYKTENTIKSNTQAIKEQTEATDGNAMSVKDLIDKLGIQLPAGADKALEGVGNFSTASAAKFAAVVAAVKLVIDAVKELAEITQEAAKKVDDLNTTSVKSGIDTYTLQVLDYMQELADVDVSTVTSSMTKLTKAMGDAADGSAKQAEAFAELGIQYTNIDGSMRNATDVFWESIDALGKIQNQTERDQVAMDIFGRSAKELNTLIAVGSEGYKKYAQEAESVGYILNEQERNALQKYQDALDRTKKQQEAISQQLAVKMSPALTELTEGWSKLKTEGLQLIMDSGIVDFLAGLVEAIGKVIGFVGDMLEVLNALLHPIETLKDLLGIQSETLEDNAAKTLAATDASMAQAQAMNAVTSVADKESSSLNKLSSQAETTTQAVTRLTNAQRQYIELMGGYAADNGEFWYDPWGNKFSASDDPESNIYVGYAQTIYTHRDANGNEYEVFGEDSRDGSAYWAAHGYTGHNAAGSYSWRGGRTVVGENGAEVVDLPQGARVYNAQDSRNMGGDVYNITIDARNIQELNDVVRIVKNSRVTARMMA